MIAFIIFIIVGLILAAFGGFLMYKASSQGDGGIGQFFMGVVITGIGVLDLAITCWLHFR